MSSVLGIRSFNPIWSEVDLTGKQFDDTFWLYTLQNTIPYNPQAVFHDPAMTTPWTDPIQFLANGTLPVDVYWTPGATYRLEFRQNNGIDTPSQSDPLIYEVNNYVPNGGGSPTPPTTSGNTSENEVANPQFSAVNFVSPTTISVAGTYEIAPGWFLELAGSGSVVINQVPLNNADINSSNAPYALRLTLTGWTANQAFLRQRFQQNGMLWANKTVSTAITAWVAAGTASLSAELVDSNSTLLTTVLNAVSISTALQEYTDHGSLGTTTNPNVPPAAYIDYKLILPQNTDLFVSSIQLLVQDLADIDEPAFVQDSIDRQIDHLFHYYNPQLMYKPIPSYLVGWDFPLNPAQFGASGTTGAIGANKSVYAWDQTILFSSVNSGLGFNRTGGDTSLSFQVTPVSNTSWAMIQYLPQQSARELLYGFQAIAMRARVSTSTVSGTISLWYTKDANLPNINPGTNNSLVVSIASGFPTCGSGGSNGTWIQVTRDLGNAPFTLTTTMSEYKFNGYKPVASAESAAATYMAIVVCFDTTLTTQSVVFDYVSLMAGDIATRPAPLNPAEVLEQCQYYYEKNLDQNSYPGIGSSGALVAQQQTSPPTGSTALGVISSIARSFTIQYNTVKRSLSPNVTVYSINTRVINNVYMVIFNGGANIEATDASISNWTVTYKNSKSCSFIPNTAAALTSSSAVTGNQAEAYLACNYVIDARFGIVN